jgi:methionyl-tRNA formyltransferase
MPQHIILLTGDTEFPFLSKALQDANPALTVRHANSSTALSEAMAQSNPQSARLLSFSTNIIVPASVLSALPGPSYNFHPGPQPIRVRIRTVLRSMTARPGSVRQCMK